MRQPHILITGGAGYIGSHTAKAVAQSGLVPVVFDNLSNGQRDAVVWGPFVHGDVRDVDALQTAMIQQQVTGVIISRAGSRSEPQPRRRTSSGTTI